MSVAKHVLTYCKRSKIDQEKINEISQLLSHLGQIWAKIKFAKITIQTTIECCPFWWSLLGSFRCDQGSCFGQGISLQNPDKKYAFGADPNVFLVLFHENNLTFEENTDTIKGRLLLTINDGIFHFSNGFGFAHKPNIMEFCKDIFKQLTGEKQCGYEYNKFLWSGGLTYTDGPVISVGSSDIIKNMKPLRYNLITDFAKERGLV